MSWFSEAFGRLVASLQRFAQPAALKTTFMGREVDCEQRARVRGTEVSKLLGRPNPYMTGYDLIYDLVATRSLYDTAYWFIMEGDSGKVIHPFPPAWVTPLADSYFAPRSYRVQV